MSTFTELLDELHAAGLQEGQDPAEFLVDPKKLSAREHTLFLSALKNEAGPNIKPSKAIIPQDRPPLETYHAITGDGGKLVFDRQKDCMHHILLYLKEWGNIQKLLKDEGPIDLRAFLDGRSFLGMPSSRTACTFSERLWNELLLGFLSLYENTALMLHVEEAQRCHPFFTGCPIPLPEHLSLTPIRWEFKAFRSNHTELFDQWGTFITDSLTDEKKIELAEWLAKKMHANQFPKWTVQDCADFVGIGVRTYYSIKKSLTQLRVIPG
jgi:hypothetical protein